MRIKPYELVPDRWFNAGILEHRDGTEEHFIAVWLPSWGMFYDVANDAHRWGHRVLYYFGRRGFRIGHRFPVKATGEHT